MSPFHVNMNNILNEKSTVFQTKMNEKEWYCFTFLYVFLISGFTKENWILTSASAFILLQYIWVEKLASIHSYEVGKEQSNLIDI